MKKKFVLVLIVALILVPSCLFAEGWHTKDYGTVHNTDELLAVIHDIYFHGYTEDQPYEFDEFKAIVYIGNDFTVTKLVGSNSDNGKESIRHKEVYNYMQIDLIIYGQGNTLSFNFADPNYFKKYALNFYDLRSVTINDLTIELKGYAERGMQFQKCRSVVLNNVSILEKHDTEEIGNLYSESSNTYKGILVQNNDSKITVKGDCTFETDLSCWSAMDIDNKHLDASLTFDEDAKITFIDNRAGVEKTNEPIIKEDPTATNELSVTYPEAFPLHETTNGHNLHAWEYSVEEGTITAKCAGESCAFHSSGVSISLEPLAKTTTIKTTVVPVFADNTKLEWTSYNPKVATVDENGNVTAVGAGTSTITAVTTDGSNLSINCEVTVKSL